MNNQISTAFQKATNFAQFCEENGITFEMIEHLQKDDNMKKALELTGFPFLKEGEILYKDGDRITGNEKVIRTEEYEGATIHFISDNAMKISGKDLLLKQNNQEAINAFSKKGYKENKVVNEWPKDTEVPEWIYFVKIMQL